MNLINKILQLIETDDCNIDTQSSILKNTYLFSDVAERKRIDLCFINLCGYSLETLIKEKGII